MFGRNPNIPSSVQNQQTNAMVQLILTSFNLLFVSDSRQLAEAALQQRQSSLLTVSLSLVMCAFYFTSVHLNRKMQIELYIGENIPLLPPLESPFGQSRDMWPSSPHLKQPSNCNNNISACWDMPCLTKTLATGFQ